MNSFRKRAALGFTANIETDMNDYSDWPVNYPVIRYEDVLYGYAEILTSKGNISAAMDIVNKIRSRAGCDLETVSNAGEALNFIKRCFENAFYLY